MLLSPSHTLPRILRCAGFCVLSVVLTSGLIASCGWHAGGLAPEGAKTVGVEVFWTNEKVLERDLEPDLQRELARAASDLSGLSLARVDQADLVLRGKIKEYRRRSGIRSPDNELLETGIRILVEAELVDRRDGSILGRAPARVWSGYALIGPDQEHSARDRALRHIAETLTLSLFQPQTPQSETSNSTAEEPK